MILGIILPNRLSKYQEDWKYPILRLAEGQRDLDMTCYVAMRLAADLTGIVTPESLVGHVAADLGIEKYGMAYLALTSFATSYMNVSSGE